MWGDGALSTLPNSLCTRRIPSATADCRPRTPLITPQILRVAKVLAHTAKFRSALVNGGGDMGSQREQLERPLDVLVGTPQRVMQHAGASRLPGCCWAVTRSRSGRWVCQCASHSAACGAPLRVAHGCRLCLLQMARRCRCSLGCSRCPPALS